MPGFLWIVSSFYDLDLSSKCTTADKDLMFGRARRESDASLLSVRVVCCCAAAATGSSREAVPGAAACIVQSENALRVKQCTLSEVGIPIQILPRCTGI